MVSFDNFYTEVFLLEFDWWVAITDLDNVLAPSNWQAIIWSLYMPSL